MGSVKLYARVPKLADDAAVLLWEPWRAEIEVNPHDAGKCEDYSIAVTFPPIQVHHATKSLSCLWVASEDCPKCHGTGDAWNDKAYEASPCLVCGTKGIVGPTGEGRDAAGNSVRLELPPLEIGFELDKTWEYPTEPPRLVTAPMQVKVTLGFRNLATTVSMPAQVVRHPLFQAEGDGVWSSVGELHG
jgi:hypothetical protein